MGIVEINTELNTIVIFAQLFFYGNKANEALSIQIAADINTFWNIPNGYVDYNNRRYRFFLNAIGNYAPELTPQHIIENTDARKNYIRIEEYCKLDVSFVDGLNSNTGYFKLANILNNSTTAAHEFGHSLGLDHPDVLDVRGAGTPGIMYPRGTLVDAHFQYDPSVEAGAVGGTVNPIHRRVLQQDIDNLQIEKLKFDKDGRAVIGNFTNIYHQAHIVP